MPLLGGDRGILMRGVPGTARGLEDAARLLNPFSGRPQQSGTARLSSIPFPWQPRGVGSA